MTDAAARLYSSRPLSWSLDISTDAPASRRPHRNSQNPEKTAKRGQERQTPSPWVADVDDLRSLADVRRSILCTCLVSLDKTTGAIQADPGFTRRFVWDVAGALQIPRSWVIVDRIFGETEGGIASASTSEMNSMARVHLLSIGTDEERGGREATDLAKELQAQAKCSQSALKTGGSTCDVVAVEILLQDASNQRKVVMIDEAGLLKAELAEKELAELRASNDRLVARLERCTCHQGHGPPKDEVQSDTNTRCHPPLLAAVSTPPAGSPAGALGSEKPALRKLNSGADIMFSSRAGPGLDPERISLAEDGDVTNQHLTPIKTARSAASRESARHMREQHAEFVSLETRTHRIVQFHMATSLVSIGLAMLSHEVWMDRPEDPSLLPLKIIQSLFTAALCATVAYYYRCNRAMRVLQGRAGVRSWQSIVTAASLLLEICVIIPHPVPYLDFTFTIYESAQEKYYFDTLLTTFVMLRVYVAIRFFRSTMIYRHRYTRALGITKHDVRTNSVTFWIKYALERDSIDTLLAFFVIFLFWAAYMVRLAESGGREERFIHYQDCMWFVIVTASTTGYGDLAPETTLGRSLAVMIMVVGICSAAIVTALLTERTRLGSDESRFVTAVSQARLVTRKKHTAASLICAFFRFVVRVRKGRDRHKALAALVEKAAVTRRKRLRITLNQREVPCASALLEDVHNAIFSEEGLKEMLLQVNNSIRKDMHLFQTDLDTRLASIERRVSCGKESLAGSAM